MWRIIARLLTTIIITVCVRAADEKPVVVDGAYLKAFTVAYSDFRMLRELPPEKKDLRRYTVHFDGDPTYIVVTFIPKFPPGWFGVGGETPFGRDVSYSIYRSTNKIAKRQFGE